MAMPVQSTSETIRNIPGITITLWLEFAKLLDIFLVPHGYFSNQVVEVKTTLRRGDIDDHLERMRKVRKYADDHGDKREFLGAIAATITDKDTKEYALSKGFYVIEPSGEDVKITKPVSEKVW
ncbi:hypothetical protein AGMMS49928_29590 [Spirochaetia bacterium]|nr:hypothetical protein AGMMS49928_29590 [Spirochaetia bacterium]